MEVLLSLDNVIFHNPKKKICLWCNRADGRFTLSSDDSLKDVWNPVSLGTVHGIIGKMQTLHGSDWQLLVISERDLVGYLMKGIEIYCIKKVTIIPITTESIDLSIFDLEQPTTTESNEKGGTQRVQQTWNNLKNSANNLTNKSNNATKDKEKMERRLTEELFKMFNDSGSFYYSPNGDLSNTQQRLEKMVDSYNWRQTDDRFFWNKFMLKELIEMDDPSTSHWIQPIIQGFVQIERCFIDHLEDLNNVGVNSLDNSMEGLSEDEEEESTDQLDAATKPKYKTGENMKEDEFDLIIISRRSRHRAGTRYKRRGVDDEGRVANYVETEQIVCVLNHVVSYVQVRGSVPVYWSQPGTKYRPLPIIDKEFEESRIAFSKHFHQEFQVYKKQVIISLVELMGREKIVADSFLKHIFDFDSDKLTFVTFDFHEYCRGMKFENVSVLINAIEEVIRRMSFHWVDDSGVISHQDSVCRVNCMDCLDRTNVVQAAVGRNVLLNVLRKLGRLLPDEVMPHTCRRIFNTMWANNGDAISRQYAGTAAMKGDFTRTGERKIAGVMKDGYNSANRYYLNRFKDNYRQTVIDMMLGNSIVEDLSAIASAGKSNGDDDVWTSEKEESIAQLVRHSQLTLLPPDEECLGGWALVDPFSFALPNDPPQDEDIILLVTHQAYYVARYNDAIEELSSYQRIPLECLEKIEIGMETFYFKSQYIFMRIHYCFERNSGYFHTVRTIQNRSMEESKEILLSISGIFLNIANYQSFPLKITESKIEKKRSKEQPNVRPLSSKRTLSTSSRSRLRFRQGADNRMERRRSRSLSDIDKQLQNDSPCQAELNQHSSNFEEYHQSYSPKNMPKYIENNHRLHNSILKSNSDNEIVRTESTSNKPASKVDAFLRKTKTALGTVGPKLRDISFGKDDSATQQITGKQQLEPRQQQQQQQQSEGMKITLRKFNDRFINRAVEVKSKMIPEFRNRLQNVLNPSQKMSQRNRLLTEEEKERRMNCKTKILEL